MAFLSVLVILGTSIPFCVLFTSSKALAWAMLPSVFMANDCAKEGDAKIEIIKKGSNFFNISRYFHGILIMD